MYRNILNLFDSFIAPSFSTEALSLFRKVLAIFYAIYLILIFPSLYQFYFLNQNLGHFFYLPFWLLKVQFFLGSIPIHLFWIAAFYLSVLLFLGKKIRLCLLFLFLFQSFLSLKNPFSFQTEDALLPLLFFFGFFFPWTGVKGLWGGWSIRLAQLFVISIYLRTFFIDIFSNPSWMSGNALYYLLRDPGVGNFSEFSFGGFSIFFKYLNFIFLIVIVVSPFLLLFKKTRKASGMALLALHGPLAFMFDSFFFFSLMMILSLAPFYLDKVPDRFS